MGNVPGARYGHTMIVDSATRAVYVFGGNGYGASESSWGNLHVYFSASTCERFVLLTGLLNDLWMFNLTSNQWTWISGANETNAFGFYGTLGLSSPLNQPGARFFQSMIFNSKQKYLLIFGGNGRGSNTVGITICRSNDID